MKFDLEFEQGDLPEAWMPLEAVIVVKGFPMDPSDPADVADDVGVEMFSTATKGLTTWEALGLLEIAADRLRTHMREG